MQRYRIWKYEYEVLVLLARDSYNSISPLYTYIILQKMYEKWKREREREYNNAVFNTQPEMI